MSNNIEILNALKLSINALNDTITEAEAIGNFSFVQDRIKQGAIHIYEQAQLIDINAKTKQTVEIKIIKSEPVIVPDAPKENLPIIEPIAEIEVEVERPVPVINIPVINIPVTKKEVQDNSIPQAIENKNSIPAIEEDKKAPAQEKLISPISTTIVSKQDEIDNDEATVNGKLAKFKQPVVNLADKLKDTPIKELVKTISISKKFEFINELFQGNADAYKSCILAVETAGSFAIAADYIESEVAETYAWNENEDLAAEFFLLVKRRYL